MDIFRIIIVTIIVHISGCDLKTHPASVAPLQGYLLLICLPLSPCSTQSSSPLCPDEGGRRHQAVRGADPPESGREGPQAYLRAVWQDL